MTNSTNKAFILYKDSLQVVDQLTDQQAGKLFKAIICYQNTGEVSDVDQITKIIITPFLSQFTRDEEKYKNSIIQGKLGNLKKYHNDIYLRIVAEELTIEEAENLAYPDKKLLGRPPITPDQVGSHKDKDSVKDKDSIKKTISTKKPKIDNSQFEEFWNLYDKKIGIAEAKNKFALALSKDSFENIIAGVKKYITTRGIESKFWKHPTTWLNQECWKDEYSQSGSQNNQTLCQVINALIGQEWINKIEAQEDKAIISITQSNWAKMKLLDIEIKKQINQKLTDELKTTSIKQKYID
jgi:hypothetical protein